MSTIASSRNQQMAGAFGLLHSAIQEELYRMRWTELRPIQVEAVHKILGGSEHIIISAMTAGGKTEAAFLPILSRLVEDHDDGVRALYVGPLKALINDQFRRLEDLCDKTGIPVHKWHGDVGQSSKKRLLDKPSGVLLITPESIESLFVNHPSNLLPMFSRLKYVVIDELHSFIGTERGIHLMSLLSRLRSLSQNKVRYIALSATIGDLDVARKWISPLPADKVELIEDSGEKEIRYLVRGYLRSRASIETSNGEPWPEPVETPDDLRLASDIIRSFYGKTALIFVNSKTQLEFYSDLVRRILDQKNLPNGFRVHHGSLSKCEREETENALRSSRSTAAFCSSTLEMGIDVGNVKAIGQIGPPWTVNSLTQRLGRSGRLDNEPSVGWVFVEEEQIDHRSDLVYRLFPRLLQSIAVTELMLQKWCEPPNVNGLHISTLVQQIMSVILYSGGANAGYLFSLLAEKGPFRNVSREVFVKVLRDMGSADLIEQAPNGDLILGLVGENVTRSQEFYAAFVSPQEMRVLNREGHDIGSILSSPEIAEGNYLILSGRRWRVVAIDLQRQVVIVEPSFGGKLPFFGSAAGPDLHSKVREKMREVLCGDSAPAYLDSRAKEMLSMARVTAQELGLQKDRVVSNGQELVWLTWTGTAINRTAWGLCGYYAGLNVEDCGIGLTFRGTTEEDMQKAFRRIVEDPPAVEELAAFFAVRVREKYDCFLSDEMKSLVFSRNCLDLGGAISLLSDFLRRG